MKIYWVINTDRSNLLLRYKCFFKLTREEAQYEVDFRIKEGSPDYIVEEEEVPDEKFGFCVNGFPGSPAPALVLPDCNDCSVGMIRKMRNGLLDSEDNGKCDTCPYYRHPLKIIMKEQIEKADVFFNKNHLFVFGDNDVRKGFGGLAKEVRGSPNSAGIRVKKYPSMSHDSFYNDGEFNEQKKKIDKDIEDIVDRSIEYEYLVFPKSPIGSGRANLPNKSPRTYKYLMEKLKVLGINY